MGFGKTSLLIKVVEECPTGCFSSFRALSSAEGPAEFVEATIEKMNLEYKQQLPKHESLLRSFFENIEEFSVLDEGVAIRHKELTPENITDFLYPYVTVRSGSKGGRIL